VTHGFRIEALSSAHNRKSFASGVEPLDRYFRELVTQDVKRRVSTCFVALDTAGVIAGYYTLAAASLPLTELSADEKQRLPRYALLPAGIIGRLAVDQKYQGQGLGSALIIDAAATPRTTPSSLFISATDLGASQAGHRRRSYPSRQHCKLYPPNALSKKSPMIAVGAWKGKAGEPDEYKNQRPMAHLLSVGGEGRRGC
jgi:GNAT superfamily N-acetyltransferase